MGSADDQKQIVGRLEAFDPGPSIAAAVEALASIGAEYAMIGGLALDAWGISRATKDVDFAVHTGVAEKLSAHFEASGAEVRPLRIGGIGVRIEKPAIRIDLIDRRFYLRLKQLALFRTQLFAVVETFYATIAKHHGGGNYRTGQWSPARFVDTDNHIRQAG